MQFFRKSDAKTSNTLPNGSERSFPKRCVHLSSSLEQIVRRTAAHNPLLPLFGPRVTTFCPDWHTLAMQPADDVCSSVHQRSITIDPNASLVVLLVPFPSFFSVSNDDIPRNLCRKTIAYRELQLQFAPMIQAPTTGTPSRTVSS